VLIIKYECTIKDLTPISPLFLPVNRVLCCSASRHYADLSLRSSATLTTVELESEVHVRVRSIRIVLRIILVRRITRLVVSIWVVIGGNERNP